MSICSSPEALLQGKIRFHQNFTLGPFFPLRLASRHLLPFAFKVLLFCRSEQTSQDGKMVEVGGGRRGF